MTDTTAPTRTVAAYHLTEMDKALIRCMVHPRSNIAAVHFDGQLLVDMVEAERRIIEASGRWPTFY